MKERSTSVQVQVQGKTKSVSMRLEEPLAIRLSRIVEVSRRTTTSVIEECLEEKLPHLEKRYRDLAKQAA
jgi:predicted transcriptional regulator